MSKNSEYVKLNLLIHSYENRKYFIFNIMYLKVTHTLA